MQGRGGCQLEELSTPPPVRSGAFVSWLMGSAVGLAETRWGYSLTGIPAVDSIAIAAMAQVLVVAIRRRSQAALQP